MLTFPKNCQVAHRRGRCTSMASSTRPGSALWWSVTLGVGSVVAFLLIGPPQTVVWRSSTALFVIVTIAASLCTVAAVALLWVAHRRQLAEAGILGAGLTVVSVLPLVHGLTAPGVLYGPNQAVTTSAFASLPLALITMAPLLAPSGQARAWVGRHWRAWSIGWVVMSCGLATLLLVRPNSIAVAGRDHPITWLVAGSALFGALAMSRVQLRLYWIGERPPTLTASIGLVLLGLTSLVWLGDAPFSIGWWAVHALDIVGVFAGIYGAMSAHRLDSSIVAALAPITTLDPLHTLELGLSPVVHRFVAALELKDPITRDHVVRTAELAVRTGERLGLEARRLRFLGLGALLHDIGKLDTPDEILNKDDRLTDTDYDIIKRHTVDGDLLLLAVPSLAPAAPFVRGHHERLDGGGYPDRLAGGSIPLEARIIAVCDGYDAMAHTRQYREGLGHDRAAAILREHSGSQWDPEVVEALLDVVVADDTGVAALEHVGRAAIACDCGDALPAAVLEQLAAVR